MKVTGEATLHAPVDRVWEALQDPGVLVRTIPGCERLEADGPDRYRMTVTAGVASIKGTYSGDIALSDQEPPAAFVLHARGAGAPGTVDAEVKVSLEESGDSETRLRYDADAVVGGVIGGVGQRVLAGVAKKTAGEFFAAVDDVLTGRAPEPAAAAEPVPARVGAGSAAAATAGPQPAVYAAPAGRPGRGFGRGGDARAFALGGLLGAAVALAGVALGAAVAGRR